MDKNSANAARILIKNSNVNNSYDNFANSSVILQRAKELEERSKGDKVTTGIINAAGTNVITKNIMSTDIGQHKVLASIEALMEKYPGYTDGLRDIRTKGATVIRSDNYYEYPFRTIADPSQLSPPTYVASDPVKPDSTESKTEQTLTDKKSFDINDLYEGVESINLYENTYLNSNTQQAITSSNVISYSDEGIITQNSFGNGERLATYQLVPSEQITQNTVADNGIYVNVSPYVFKDKIVGQDDYHERTVLPDVRTNNEVRYRYFYCLDGITAEQRNIVTTAGYVSKPVKVAKNVYVELAADNVNNIEYSILDGNDETPVLPQDLDIITDERLFFGMMPRFTIMNPSDIVVKRNNVQIGITTQRELELFIMADNTTNSTGESSYNNNNVYTITYRPTENSRRYFTKSEIIRVKVIQRIPAGTIPDPIGNVKLYQYNVPGSWYLSSVTADSDYNPSDPRFRVVGTWNM